MAVGMAANPQEAHQAGRHMVQPHEGLFASHERDGGRVGSADRHARHLWQAATLRGDSGWVDDLGFD